MLSKLTRTQLFRELKNTAQRLEEHRNPAAPNYQFPIWDVVMTAFAAFFFQQPSFRSHEQDLKGEVYRENCSKLFDCEAIPSTATVRNVLDPVDPAELTPAFDGVFRRLDRSGLLTKMRYSDELGMLVCLDGVDYFDSEEISCKNCNTAKRTNGRVLYSHKMLAAGIAHPSENHFIPLAPEFITPQDGSVKQDCEQRAGERWMANFRKRHKAARVTLLLDNLYCNHKFLTQAADRRFNFIARCKKGGNKALYEWIETARQGGDTRVFEARYRRKGKFYRVKYEYLNGVPIRASEDALKVNFCSMEEIEEETGKTRLFEYVTNRPLNQTNASKIAHAGRRRWKVENENNNTLKNQGYYFDHNYGHGKQHLSSVIATLILYSFMVHSILRVVKQDGLVTILDSGFSRLKCFARMTCLLSFLVLSSWDELYSVTLKALGAT